MARFWHKIGHRGTPREFPGNTMRGFKRALELGCTFVECDVQQARDGVLILAHDSHVTDTDGRTYVVAETPSGQLHTLDLGGGEGVPYLDELTAWAAGRCGVMADMKCEGNGIEEAVVAALSGLENTAKVVPGAGSASRARFHDLDASLPLALTLSDSDALTVEGENLDTLLAGLDTQTVTWHHSLLNAACIARLHAQQITVFAWTVDDLPTMRRLLANNVDGIISNRPDLMQGLTT